MSQSWPQRLSSVLDLFLDKPCPICQRPTAQPLCVDCQHQVQQCRCQRSHHTQAGLPPVFTWGNYRAQLKQAITLMKYENQPQLAKLLGQWLGQDWLSQLPTSKAKTVRSMVIVPIPLHRDRQQQRGYNQAQLLAKHFCQVTGYQLNTELLRRVRKTQAQFGLSAVEREQNLAQAFAIGSGIKQHRLDTPVLLLDDIYTTGATVKSAFQVCQQQGISVRGIIALSIAQR